MPDRNDELKLRHIHNRHKSHKRYNHSILMPAPMFFTQEGHHLPLIDMYRGRSVFLIASGPSFLKVDKVKLAQPGIVTMGLNNSPRTFRPNLWTCVDQPDHWIRSIFLDPKIMKFCPLGWHDREVFNSDTWTFMQDKLGQCPNMVYYRRNERFRADQYLFEDRINWGNHKDFGGGRSVLLAAIRILFLLGFRRVNLLGVDFDMSETSKYHFDQDRHRGAIKGNNSTYQFLQKAFTELKPHFERAKFEVFNCNPESKLTAFPKVSFDEAHDEMLSHFDFVDVANERTRGLYDTKTEDKKKGLGK